MKKPLFLIVLGLSALGLHAQTMNVCTGSVTTAINASADEMPYSDGGSTFTVVGKKFVISDVDSIYIDNSQVDDNTVNIIYNGTSARVLIAGNVAKYLTTTVTGAHVSIIQSEDLENEITYTLQGSSTDGSFWMDGELKATLVFNGLNLTCADSAAVNIRNGKRIAISLADGTTNTLVDGANGSQKACFAVKGHAEFKGGGTLNLTGNAKHAFASNEYCELKKSLGTINILSAKTDGMNISQYFEMKGGTITMSNLGDDGIQVDATDDTTDELNGRAFIKGGSLNITVSAESAKGLKVADSLFVAGGTTTIKATGTGGKGIVGSTNVEISDGVLNVTTTGSSSGSSSGGWGGWGGGWGGESSSGGKAKGIKAKGNLLISGGETTVSTLGGDGSEGIESKATMTITGGDVIVNAYDDALNASSKIDIQGGRIFACSTGNDAIDSNGTLYISGGLVIAAGTREPEGSFDCDQNTFSVTGGTLIGFGGDTSTPTTSVTTQPVVIQSGKSFTKGQYLALGDASGNAYWAVAVPQTYSSCKLVVSDPNMSVGSSYTLATNVTKTGGTEWQGYTEDATISGGTSSTISVTSMVTSSNNGGGGNHGGGGPGGGGRP